MTTPDRRTAQERGIKMGNRVIEEFHPEGQPADQRHHPRRRRTGPPELDTHGSSPARPAAATSPSPATTCSSTCTTRNPPAKSVRGRLDRRLVHRLPPPEESRNGTASRDRAGDDGPRLRIRHRAARPRHRPGHRGDPDRQTRLDAARPSRMDQCRRDLAGRRGHRTRRPRATQHRTVTPSRRTPNPPSRICCPTDLHLEGSTSHAPRTPNLSTFVGSHPHSSTVACGHEPLKRR